LNSDKDWQINGSDFNCVKILTEIASIREYGSEGCLGFTAGSKSNDSGAAPNDINHSASIRSLLKAGSCVIDYYLMGNVRPPILLDMFSLCTIA
jgi:hypothetical protein